MQEVRKAGEHGAKNGDGWVDFHSFISHVPATLGCLLERQWPARRHQAHSKSRPNYGQMRGSSLCLRTKPEVTQLVFKGSSHSRGWGEGGPVGGGRWPAGYKYLFGQLLEGKFAVCLSSTHPGGGPGGCKTSQRRAEGERERERGRQRGGNLFEFDCQKWGTWLILIWKPHVIL